MLAEISKLAFFKLIYFLNNNLNNIYLSFSEKILPFSEKKYDGDKGYLKTHSMLDYRKITLFNFKISNFMLFRNQD